MSRTIHIDMPNAETQAYRNVVRSILSELIGHNLTLDQTIKAIEDLTQARAQQESSDADQ